MAVFRTITLLLAATLTSACEPDIIGPDTSLEGLPPGLRVKLTVEPAIVSVYEPFTVRLDITNTTTGTLEVVTAHGCLTIPNVMRNGTRIPFEGSWWGCTAAITRHVFVPGETRTRVWEMRAQLYAEHPGDRDGAPAPPGVYSVQAEFDTYSENGPNVKPAIERALVVR